MAGTIDSAVEKERDKNPATVAEKKRKLESDQDQPEVEREKKLAHESPRETPKNS
jgi:hypothetical protein